MPYLDPLPVVHGVAISMQEEGEGLRRHGWEVHVAAPRWAADDDAPSNINGVIYHRWRPDFLQIIQECAAQGLPPFPDGYLSFEVQALRELASGVPFDLLHVREPHGVMTGVSLKMELGIPFIMTLHTFTPVYYQHLYGRNVPKDAGQRWTDYCLAHLEEIDRVVAVSETVRASYTDYGFPPDRIAVVPHGVDVERFAPRMSTFLQTRHNLAANTQIALAVSRLEPAKGQAVLLHALPSILRHYPDLRVVLLGGRAHYEEAYRQELQDLALQLGVADAILFDSLTYAEMPHAYASSTVVVATSSIYEGFGRPLIEAAACGKPVVATDLGAHAEIVIPDSTGYLIPAGDPLALSESVNAVLGAPELQRAFGNAARHRALDHYRLDQCVARYVEVYASALQRYH